MQCETLGRRSLPVSVFIYKLKQKKPKTKTKNPQKSPLDLVLRTRCPHKHCPENIDVAVCGCTCSFVPQFVK